MIRRLIGPLIPASILALAIIFGPGLLSMRPVQAQFSGQSTFIPAGNVGGIANAVTLTIPNINSLNNILGVPLSFVPKAQNAAGGTTITVNSLATESVLRTSNASLVLIAGGDFNTAAIAQVVWDGTQFEQTNPASGNDPVGTEKTFTNGVPVGYLIEDGSCILQSTYAALYAYYGSTDLWLTQAGGSACPGGQFHLPFANGRTAVAYDTQGARTAGVLTNAGSNCPATVVAVGCGSQSETMAQANLPSVNFTVTIPSGQGSHSHTFGPSGGAVMDSGANGNTGWNGGGAQTTAFSTNAQTLPSMTGTAASGGFSQPLITVQPTYTVLKAVKY